MLLMFNVLEEGRHDVKGRIREVDDFSSTPSVDAFGFADLLSGHLPE